jgi:hypothetical protein
MGDRYLRKLPVTGATSVVRRARSRPKTVDRHLADLLAKACALRHGRHGEQDGLDRLGSHDKG